MSKAAQTSKIYADLVFDDLAKNLIIERLRCYVQGPDVLDIGYAGDDLPQYLLDWGCEVMIIEQDLEHCRHASKRFPKVSVASGRFENFDPEPAYNTVFSAGVLEVIPEPGDFLERCRGWLVPGGTLILTTPNRRSLHRRIGALMGIEPDTEALNDQARQTGAVKLYDRYELISLVRAAGFEILLCRGFFLKPLPSRQMAQLSDTLIRALMDVGDELSDYAKQLVVVGQKSPLVREA